MARTIMGVEIGNYRIKLAVCTGTKLDKLVVADVPDNLVRNSQIISWEAMSDFIREVVRENRISCKNVAIALPDDSTYIKKSIMPAMTIDQLKVNLPYEFHDFITDDKDEYFYDYSVVDIVEDAEGKTKEMELLSVAVKQDLIENYKAMFRRAGLKLMVAMPEVIGFRNIIDEYELRNGINEDRDYGILDIGHSTVKLHLFNGGEYDVTRTMEIGHESLNRIIAEKLDCDEHIAAVCKEQNKDNILECEECMDFYNQLAVEVTRVINFYGFNQPDNNLETIYYCGGGAFVRPCIEVIRANIDLELAGLNLLIDPSMASPKDAVLGPAAMGINWE